MKKEKVKSTNTKSGARRRLSLVRVLIFALIMVGAFYSGKYGWNKHEETKSEAVNKPWFAAYTDITAKPTYAFEQLGATSTPDVVLSFIVSSKEDPCIPTWGTYHTLEEASIALDLDRRIARLRQQGGNVSVSFGGAINDELALKCTDSDLLLKAYLSVVERYELDTIDLDLENTGLTDTEASTRRAKVIARLQEGQRAQDKDLAVWLTLPVAPQGLTQDGTNVIAEMLRNGVDIAGVNVMTMDYGGSLEPGQTVLEGSTRALTETHRQLGILYKQAGINISSGSVWKKVGATPMIGQNDIVAEVFTLEDAEGLNKFAQAQGIGRMSMWSINRDIPCGENYVDVKIVSDSCSGVKSPKSSFAQALHKGFEGRMSQHAGTITTEDLETNVEVVDDPESSPYQIWKPTGAYPKGVKVVWHGNVYEAKWWTKNDLPDNPVLQSWETPWQLMGPVLPGETPIKQPTLPENTYPQWSGTTIYEGGNRVLFEGTPFQAKWWNQGESPAAAEANPDTSPWLPLTQAQILELLEGLE